MLASEIVQVAGSLAKKIGDTIDYNYFLDLHNVYIGLASWVYVNRLLKAHLKLLMVHTIISSFGENAFYMQLKEILFEFRDISSVALMFIRWWSVLFLTTSNLFYRFSCFALQSILECWLLYYLVALSWTHDNHATRIVIQCTWQWS